MANDQAAAEADSEERAIEAWNNRAHLAQPAQAVDEAMVERALAYRARQEDGAVWPDAYGTEEQAAEREQMRAMLSEALDANGPKAYCRACQRAGMSNCGYFDECAGATCITCHRPFATTRALRREGGPVGDVVAVPREPTAQMIAAGSASLKVDVDFTRRPNMPTRERAARNAYVSMLAASPAPDKEG